MAVRHPAADFINDLLDRRNQTQAWLGARVAELEGRDSPYSQPSVSGWMENIDRQPPARVFLIEQALDQRPGTISRTLGYLPVEARPARSVAEALDADARLSDASRRVLLAAYQQAIRHP